MGDGRSTLPAIRLPTYVPPNYPYLSGLGNMTSISPASSGIHVGLAGFGTCMSAMSGLSGSPQSSVLSGSPEWASPTPFQTTSATNTPKSSHPSRSRTNTAGPRERSSSAPNVAHQVIRFSADTLQQFEVCCPHLGLQFGHPFQRFIQPLEPLKIWKITSFISHLICTCFVWFYALFRILITCNNWLLLNSEK